MTAAKVLLIILDGWGIAPQWGGNVITQANPRFYQYLWRNYPHSQLEASGTSVGLLPMIKGNSEAGHLNIGAGRIVLEGYTLINHRLNQQPLVDNQAITTALAIAQKRHRPIHIMGLLSNGGIHSHIDHLFDLIDLASEKKLDQILLHLFTDGRDSGPKSAIEFLDRLERRIYKLKSVKIATLIGRYWAMDRDSRYDRTRRAFDALVQGIGESAPTAKEAIADAYRRGLSDEFISPTIILDQPGKSQLANPQVQADRIQTGDSVIFFNFRSDRARQLTRALVLGRLGETQLGDYPKNLTFVTFIPYQAGLPIIPAFSPDVVSQPLAWVLAKHHRRQLHLAETEKYAHVTYFFNGGHEQPMPEEDRILIPSPKVATYNLTPSMSTPKITQALQGNLRKKFYDFIIANLANPDMIGHTGIFEASLLAVLAVDQALKQIIPPALQAGYTTIITADHGNIEGMINPTTGEPDTEHTRNRVPFILASPTKSSLQLRQPGILADVAPTILQLMGLPIPATMTGRSLIV